MLNALDTRCDLGPQGATRRASNRARAVVATGRMDEVDEEKIDGLVTRLLDEEGARTREFLPYSL